MSEELREQIWGGKNSEKIFGNTWSLTIVCVLSGVIVIAFGIGFLISPATQQHREHTSLFENIADAIGHHVHGHETFAAPTPETIPTYVVWD